jgi:hypothetical protein
MFYMGLTRSMTTWWSMLRIDPHRPFLTSSIRVYWPPSGALRHAAMRLPSSTTSPPMRPTVAPLVAVAHLHLRHALRSLARLLEAVSGNLARLLGAVSGSLAHRLRHPRVGVLAPYANYVASRATLHRSATVASSATSSASAMTVVGREASHHRRQLLRLHPLLRH